MDSARQRFQKDNIHHGLYTSQEEHHTAQRCNNRKFCGMGASSEVFCEVKGMVDPHLIKLFDKHLFALIEEWRLNNKEVLLLIDANEDVYKGKFA